MASVDAELGRLVAAADEARARRDYRGALELLERAHRRAPTDVPLMVDLGWARLRAQPGCESARRDSRDLFERALETDPSVATARLGLGRIHRMEGRLAPARGAYTEALTWDANREEAPVELARLAELESRVAEVRPTSYVAASTMSRLRASARPGRCATP